MPTSNAYPPLILTLRFASHLPDLTLSTITNPAQTTALSLLPQIRHNLPSTHSSLRILLISSGRVLPLRDPLSTSLKLPTTKKLGKAPANRIPPATEQEDTSTLKYTIHATFSLPDSSLTEDDLSAERSEGTYLNTKLRSTSSTEPSPSQPPSPSSLHQILQGFDRLCAPEIGFSNDDIANLRTQFRALVARDRADDGPLTPMEYLALEERWLDDAADPSGPGDLSALFQVRDGGEGGAADAAQGSHIDDVLWGNILGFFWPLGGLFWFVRQEGAWRERRRVSVFVGVLVNLMFCLIRLVLVGGASGGG